MSPRLSTQPPCNEDGEDDDNGGDDNGGDDDGGDDDGVEDDVELVLDSLLNCPHDVASDTR